jgi:hypothetical protein
MTRARLQGACRSTARAWPLSSIAARSRTSTTRTSSVAAFGAVWIGRRELLGPQRVRDLTGEEADERHRFEIVNVWRPIRGPLRDTPLAVCDATSVTFTDFVPSDLVYRDQTGETYRVKYKPALRRFYVPEMRVDAAILIK